MEYTTDYFIKKFEVIHEHLWATGAYSRLVFPLTSLADKQYCAMGFCGQYSAFDYTEESRALNYLFVEYISYTPQLVNDGRAHGFQIGITPKQRIMHALYYIKEKQEGNLIGQVPYSITRQITEALSLQEA